MTPLQKVLVQALHDSGMNATELARAAGLSVSTVTALIRGDRGGSMDTWQSLLDVIDVEIGYRFRGGISIVPSPEQPL